MAKLVAGEARDAAPLERELMGLVRKGHEQPRLLCPADLDPLRKLVGAGALDYALVLGSFHFVNRMADLLDVSPEALPTPLRRFEPLRRLGTRMASVFLRKTMDLENRPYERSYQEVLTQVGPAFERALGRPPGEELAPLRERPKLVEAIGLMLEERQERSGLDPAVLSLVDTTVEAALGACPEDVQGLHPRPADAVEAFAFVGTRYASRTTGRMIDALREAGYDDLGILDLAIAVADANNWARLHRLVGLPSELGYAG